MVRVLPAGLLTALQATPLQLAHVFTIGLLDGSTFRFTDHDRNIDSGIVGNPFIASNAIGFQAIEASTGDVAVNTEIVLNYVDGLSRHLAIGGAYDNAVFMCDMVCWSNPSAGRLNLLTGTLMQKNTTNKDNGSFTVKGKSREIDGFLVELFGPECRANLGDARCRVDLAPHTFGFNVTSVADPRRIFTAEITGGDFPTADFAWGRLRFVGDVLDIEISSHTAVSATLHLLTLAIPRVTANIEVGSLGDITRGCNKTLTRCMFYDNVVNRRAEDFLPGPDIAIKKATSDF